MKTILAIGLAALCCAGCSTDRQARSNANLLPALRPYVKEVAGEVGTVPQERKEVLNTIAADVTARLEAGKPADLTFICTHNSRRSHMSQIWAATAAYYYGIENVNTFKPPNSSPSDTDLFRIISRLTKVRHPEALITTKMLSGYTESQLYRQLGITCYGWAPFYTTVDENEGVHGNNERITVKNVREGTREFYEVVREIAR